MRHDAVPHLPAELADAYVVRETTARDADAVHALVVADRTHHTGTCRVTQRMVEHQMAGPGPRFSAVVEKDGAVRQWWSGVHEVGTSSFSGAVTSHPGLADVERLHAAGWRAVRAWAATVVAEPGLAVLHCSRPLQDEEGQARLARTGFTATHVFWHMGGDVPQSPVPQRYPPPPGLSVDRGADARAVHDVMQEGFAEHYAYSPQTFEDAQFFYRSRPGYDPGEWYLARIDGRPAGAMILSRENETRGAIQVLELATLSWARGRGVASVLLGKAFDTARRDGLSRVELFVDSENTTGAPSLYRSVGLDVLQAAQQFQGPVSWSAPQP